MPKCNGYRPKNEVKEQVNQLRAKLSELTSDDWQYASMIMHDITALMGHNHGPSRGAIEPRACRFCHYYGHTKQHCWRKKQHEEAIVDREILEDEERMKRMDEEDTPLNARWRVWCKLAKETYDDMAEEGCWEGNGTWRAEFDRRCPPWVE